MHARPRVTIVSTGDELVPPRHARPRRRPGPRRHRARAGRPRPRGRRRPRLRRHRARRPRGAGSTLRAALTANPQPPSERGQTPFESPLEGLLPESDVVVVSAGSSVGARDETAAAIASLGEPGIWCHGLALRPGKPTLLADCGGVPVIGLPGNPRSALVVFRLIGMPIVRLVGGCTDPPPEPTVARPARARPAVRGRAARRRAGARSRRRGRSRSSAAPRCSRSSPPPTATSSCPRPPPGLRRRHRGRGHAVPVVARMPTTPFIHDRPGRRGARRLGGGLRGGRLPGAGRGRASCRSTRRSGA